MCTKTIISVGALNMSQTSWIYFNSIFLTQSTSDVREKKMGQKNVLQPNTWDKSYATHSSTMYLSSM